MGNNEQGGPASDKRAPSRPNAPQESEEEQWGEAKKTRHIKLVWGGPEVFRARWYFRLVGFYGRTEGAHDDGVAINMRRLLPLLLTLAVATWLAGAGALFRVWERDSYSLLTYSDALFLPLRRGEIQDKRGQALIAQGIDALHGKRWAEAFACLKQGLALHPRDVRARLALAQFYFATNQRSQALQFLQQGLTNQFPGREYLTTLFAIAEQAEDFGVVVQTAERYRPMLQTDSDRLDRRWLAVREFSAKMAARQYAEALAFAEAEEPGDTATEHRMMALLELHRIDEALRVVAEWRARPGADAKTATSMAVRAFREARQFDNMERALEELRKQAPAEPQPQVYAVVQQFLAGREAQAAKALDNYLFRFGGSLQNLQLVTEALAEVASVPLLERCAAAASERGYPSQPFQSMLVQAHLTRGEWERAARTLAGLKPVAGSNAPAQEQLWRDWTRRLLDAVLTPNDATSRTLVDFLRDRPWPLKAFRTTVEALRRAQQLEPAREVLALARTMHPASAWVEQQGNEVAQEIAARTPVTTGPVVAQSSLPIQRLFFQQLDESLRNGQWAVAEQLIRDARRAQPEPSWLRSRDGELRFADMQIAQALGERARMIAAAMVYLNGDTERSQRALDLARAFSAKGDRDSAIALVNEVQRRSPNFAAARELMSELRPKRGPAK